MEGKNISQDRNIELHVNSWEASKLNKEKVINTRDMKV
jgi:hypothetical protein